MDTDIKCLVLGVDGTHNNAYKDTPQSNVLKLLRCVSLRMGYRTD